MPRGSQVARTRNDETQSESPPASPSPITEHQAQQCLALLADICADRESNLLAYDPEEMDTDEENGSESPYFDKFYDTGGSGGIVNMINFDPSEFQQIWNHMADFLTKM